MKLVHNHDYYLQIQGQMWITNRKCCDFVCWTPVGMHIEWLKLDEEVFDGIKPALDLFFRDVLLPHWLKGYTTALETVESPSTSNETPADYCWCKRREFGKMTACDNRKCSSGQWFHFECVKLTRKPRGNWYCSEQCKSVAINEF